jgi:hypothetical protein
VLASLPGETAAAKAGARVEGQPPGH